MSRIVISASRRTDIPAFYMPWFMASIQKGAFEVLNPYNQKVSLVPANLDKVHSIVFWSKDFGPFLDNGFGNRLVRMGYHFFFNFTINSSDPSLEPRVPPLEERLKQLARLSERYGPGCIQWRFDPICHLQHPDGAISTNLDDFQTIARHAAASGISTCVTSFVDVYRKVRRRLERFARFRLIDPPLPQKTALADRLGQMLEELGIKLHLCCEKQVIEAMPAGSSVRAAACIPNHKLTELYGPGISLRLDPGQRTASGCGCRVSRDIGSYALHPCYHNCMFCYANPSCDEKEGKSNVPTQYRGCLS